MEIIIAGCQTVLSIVLLYAAYTKTRWPAALVAALRGSSLPAAVIPPLTILLPALEIGLALALLTSPPALLPWTTGSVTGMLLLFTVWIAWVYARRLPLACGCFGAVEPMVSGITLLRNIGLLLLSGAGTMLATRTPGLSLGLPIWWTALVSVGGAALAALAVRRAIAQSSFSVPPIPPHAALVQRPRSPVRRRLLSFLGAASSALTLSPLRNHALVSAAGEADLSPQPTPASAPAQVRTPERCTSQQSEDGTTYVRCSIQVCYCMSYFEVYESIDKSWTSIATFACYDSCDGTLCSTPAWSYVGRVCRQIGCP